jgi:outer membrane immunogenic protein
MQCRLLALLLALPFFAFSLPVLADEASPAVPFSWSGFYAGAQVGYGRGSTDSSEISDYDLTPEGGFGGLYGGWNLQLDNGFVVGVEGALSAADFDDDSVAVHPGGITVTDVSHSKVKATGSLRGRAGYALGRFLPYVTGGLALAKNDMDYTQTWAIGLATLETAHIAESKLRLGWTAGAGLEYAISDNWGMKAEFLYTDFGHSRYAGTSIFGPLAIDTYLRYSTASVGVQYKF